MSSKVLVGPVIVQIQALGSRLGPKLGDPPSRLWAHFAAPLLEVPHSAGPQTYKSLQDRRLAHATPEKFPKRQAGKTDVE